MATYKPVLQNYKRKDGLSLVQIRITKDRKTTYLSTGYYVKESEWNEKKGEVRTLNSMHAVFNSGIKKFIRNCQEQETDQLLKNEKTTAKRIKQKVRGESLQTPFAELANAYIKSRIGVIGRRTADMYYTHVANFKEFSKDATPEQITKQLIAKYEVHALVDRSENTVHRGLSALAGIWNHLQESGDIAAGINPFKGASVKQKRAEKQRLTVAEIEKLRQAKLSGIEDISRDVFLLQYFLGGLRVSDVLLLKPHNLQSGRIEFSDMKTQRQQSHLIPDQAQAILDKYEPGIYIIPLMAAVEGERGFYRETESKTAIINKHLKAIAKKLKINKHITTHVARHTFADHLRQTDANLYTISKALGHSSIKMTENYLESFDNKAVDEATNKLFKP